MAFKYFYANACYVCNKYGKEISLTICPGCHLISYCGEQHQMEHRPEHQEICEAVQSVFQHSGIENGYLNIREINDPHWSNLKYILLEAVYLTLRNRSLTRGEKQMIIYARGCAVCFRQDNLIPCENCPCASFCMEHKNDRVQRQHANQCEALMLRFDIEMICDKMELIDIHKINLHQQFIHQTPFMKLPFWNMMTFLYNCVPESEELPPHLVRIYNSQPLTRPLTLYYVTTQIHLAINDGNLVVHKIAADNFDNNMDHWEILLHLLPSVISLTIISIDPDLESTNYQTVANLCDDCIRMNKKITYEYIPMIYRAYVRTESFKKADIIVGFDAILSVFYDKNDSTIELSEESIATAQALLAQNCPYILTLMRMSYAKRPNVNLKNCYYFGPNPYKGCMPARDTYFELGFANQYIMMYPKPYLKECLMLVYET